jgi:lysophospholipase L1-like esterase
VREANRLIAATCATDRRLSFIDIFPLMLVADGRPRPELFLQDGLHMTRQGYELWIPLVRNVLEAVVPIARRDGTHGPSTPAKGRRISDRAPSP